MKKILLLILTIFCVSCEVSQQKPLEQDVKEAIPFTKVIKFSYEGHSYIKFYESVYKGAACGVVHDPNCSCHKSN